MHAKFQIVEAVLTHNNNKTGSSGTAPKTKQGYFEKMMRLTEVNAFAVLAPVRVKNEVVYSAIQDSVVVHLQKKCCTGNPAHKRGGTPSLVSTK